MAATDSEPSHAARARGNDRAGLLNRPRSLLGMLLVTSRPGMGPDLGLISGGTVDPRGTGSSPDPQGALTNSRIMKTKITR